MSTAGATIKLNRWQLLKFLLKGGVAVIIDIDCDKKTINFNYVHPNQVINLSDVKRGKS